MRRRRFVAVHLHLFPRLRAFVSSSRPLLVTHLKTLLPSRTALATPLAARARRGFSSSLATAPPAEDDNFATAAGLRFEPPLKIVQYPDPVLHARNKRIIDALESLLVGLPCSLTVGTESIVAGLPR